MPSTFDNVPEAARNAALHGGPGEVQTIQKGSDDKRVSSRAAESAEILRKNRCNQAEFILYEFVKTELAKTVARLALTPDATLHHHQPIDQNARSKLPGFSILDNNYS